MSDASAVIAEGEVLQLLTTNDTETSEEAYLEVIRSKTAKLFAAAAQSALLSQNGQAPRKKKLESYGMNLGMAGPVDGRCTRLFGGSGGPRQDRWR